MHLTTCKTTKNAAQGLLGMLSDDSSIIFYLILFGSVGSNELNLLTQLYISVKYNSKPSKIV